MIRPWVWHVAFAGALFVVLALTTAPWSAFQDHAHWEKVEWVPFTHRVVVRDTLLNVLLFVPLGFTARRVWPMAPLAVLVGAACALSVGVETSQVFTHGRLPTTIDVITNTSGAALGALWAGTIRRPDAARSRSHGP